MAISASARAAPVPKLGDWQVNQEQLLGKGGYALVYSCRKSSDGNVDAAIKIFKNSTYINAFESEVRSLQLLHNCPNVPRLLDYGFDAENRLCIVSELVAGERLDNQVARNGPLGTEVTLQMLRSLLVTLEFSHSRGLCHLDIKPSNIICAAQGFALLDWGEALGVGEVRTEGLHAMQDYLAPECYQGRFSPSSDFYSLAWVLVFSLTGVRPYHFDQIDERSYRAVAHCLERPLLPPDVTNQLTPVIYNWLRKKPEGRCVAYTLADIEGCAPATEAEFFCFKDVRQLAFDLSFMNLAAQNNIVYAQYQYAKLLLVDKRIEEAVYWLERASDLGSGAAPGLLAITLAKKAMDGVSDVRVQELLQLAASRGNNRARYMLANSMLDRGVNPSAPELLELLSAAAEAGHSMAQYQLACLLLDLDGSSSQAEVYFRKAAERGHKEARNFLLKSSG